MNGALESSMTWDYIMMYITDDLIFSAETIAITAFVGIHYNKYQKRFGNKLHLPIFAARKKTESSWKQTEKCDSSVD